MTNENIRSLEKNRLQDEDRWVCCEKIIIMIIILIIIMMMMMTTTTLHHALHLQADIDRIYFRRSEGGRGFMSVEDSVNSEINRLSRYVESCNGSLLEAVYEEEVLRCNVKSCEAASLQQERKERFQEKQLHGQFWRNTLIRDKKRREWLKKGRLKKEMEGMIIAAQDQVLRTNSIKRITDKQNVSLKCRMWGESDETIGHIVSECKKLALKQYR